MPYWHKEQELRLEVTAIRTQTSWRSRAPLETSKWVKHLHALQGEQSFIYCSPVRAARGWLHLEPQIHITLEVSTTSYIYFPGHLHNQRLMMQQRVTRERQL